MKWAGYIGFFCVFATWVWGTPHLPTRGAGPTRSTGSTRCAGRLIALAVAKEVAELPAWPDYLANLSRLELPSAELVKAREFVFREPKLFARLYVSAVLPFDPCYSNGKQVSVAEWLAEKPSKEYPEAIEEALGSYGARGARSDPRFLHNLPHTRPDLVPFFRPSPLGEFISKAVSLKISQPFRADHRNHPSWKMRAPGLFTDFKLRGHTVAEAIEAWRISWVHFDSPTQAVQHLLSGGEMARLVTESGNSLYSVARDTAALSHWKLFSILEKSTQTNHPPGKFHLSVSGAREIPFIHGRMGNLRVHLKSSRLFPVPTTLSNLGEKEYGLPLILNPREVLDAELDFGTDHPTHIQFHFSNDYSEARVLIRRAGDAGPTMLQYRWDPSRSEFRPISDAPRIDEAVHESVASKEF